MAAELTLFALLSVLPLLLVAAAGLGWVENVAGVTLAADLERFFERHVARVLGPNTPVLGVVASLFAAPSNTTFTLGLLAAVYGASRVMVSLIGSLDTITSPPDRRRGWMNTRLTGMLFALLSSVVLTIVILSITAGSRLVLSTYGDSYLALAGAKVVSFLGYLSAVAYLAWLYGHAPRHKTSWRVQIPGAVFAVLVGDLSARLLRWWFTVFNANAVFGSIGAALALLWWTYVFASGIILGSVWNTMRNPTPME